MSGIAIVSPGFPDVPGGVTDHTRRVADHWRDAGREVLVLGTTTEDPRERAARWQRSEITSVLLQYVPFLYGRHGLSRFPERLARAARAEGIRVTTFVHEPWVPPTRLPWLILSPLQQRQLRRLVHVSDVVVTPVPAWARRLGPPTQVMYVGSTLGEPPDDTSPTPALTAPVVFSPFAAGLRWEWIVAAVEHLRADPPLIVIGAELAQGVHHPSTVPWAQASWVWHGRMPAADVLRLLARAPLVLAPLVDGLTARRTSVLAAASVRARIVSSTGPLADPALADGPIALPRSKDEFVATATRLWARPDTHAAREERRHWYRERFDPVSLDTRLLKLVTG